MGIEVVDRIKYMCFSEAQMARLKVQRERYRSGELSEMTLDIKRLLFVQWLYQHGLIKE